MDNDGDEDLFVGHFVEYNKQLERDCTQKGVPHYCYPLTYDPFPSRMYRNDGNGNFTDISASSGIGREKVIPSPGAVATDINNDGLLDLFVANDSVPNFLFMNRGNGNSKRPASMPVLRTTAMARRAPAWASMQATSITTDGRIFCRETQSREFSIYRNRGDGTFSDEAAVRPALAWPPTCTVAGDFAFSISISTAHWT